MKCSEAKTIVEDFFSNAIRKNGEIKLNEKTRKSFEHMRDCESKACLNLWSDVYGLYMKIKTTDYEKSCADSEPSIGCGGDGC